MMRFSHRSDRDADGARDLADHDAVSEHRGVKMGWIRAQIGEPGRQLIELAVVLVTDIDELLPTATAAGGSEHARRLFERLWRHESDRA
ncbi:MAG TPA: hypothetical protein VNV39_02265 [Stellaceae bacterium]|jgi:hypothetical protein|nr:hypothetical protein [Stellaceae bacterium]